MYSTRANQYQYRSAHSTKTFLTRCTRLLYVFARTHSTWGTTTAAATTTATTDITGEDTPVLQPLPRVSDVTPVSQEASNNRARPFPSAGASASAPTPARPASYRAVSDERFFFHSRFFPSLSLVRPRRNIEDSLLHSTNFLFSTQSIPPPTPPHSVWPRCLQHGLLQLRRSPDKAAYPTRAFRISLQFGNTHWSTRHLKVSYGQRQPILRQKKTLGSVSLTSLSLHPVGARSSEDTSVVEQATNRRVRKNTKRSASRSKQSALHSTRRSRHRPTCIKHLRGCCA